MLQELKRLSKEKTLCEIYSDTDDTSTFGVGYVLACDDEFYIAWYADKYGFYDGMACSVTDKVYRVQTGTSYLKDMSKLMSRRSVTVCTQTDFEENLLVGFFKRIKTERRICAIELCESDCDDIYGRVVNVDETNGTVTVSMVDSRGQDDGISEFDIESVSEVYYQTRYTERLEALSEQAQ